MKKYMYVEMPEGVCCTIVTANLIKTTQTVSLQRDNHNIEMCLVSSEISILFSSATTVTTINLI